MPPENVLTRLERRSHSPTISITWRMPPATRRARHPVQLGVQAQVLLGRQIAVERRVLEDEADVAPHVVAFAHDVVPGDVRRAAARPHERAEHADRRRLARPVGPEEAERLAGGTSKSMPRTASISP